MTTIWKGAINFGLINIPIKLLSAISKEDIAFRTLHKECLSPINQKRWCAQCETDVAYENTVKGYEYEKGSFLEITKADLNSLPIKSAKYIQIEDFVALDEIDPIYFEKAYFLAPETAGEKPYLLLYKAMKDSRRAAVAKITIREKEHLCIVRVYQDALMLNTLFFADEVRNTSEINIEKIEKKTSISKAENDMANQIIQNLTAHFDIDKYHDEYREQLQALINAKLEKGDMPALAKIPKLADTKVTDLFEKLKASVEATKNKIAAPASKTKSSKTTPPPIPTTHKTKSAPPPS